MRLPKREDTKRVAFAHHQTDRWEVEKKKKKKEKVTAAVAYYGTKAVRDMQRP
jgi:hypothetical protein